MSKQVAASFLRALASNRLLREEMAKLGKKHGYVFSPNHLEELQLEDLCGGEENGDDQLSDRGFGAIEVPA